MRIMTKETAIGLLLRLFDDNKMSFQQMQFMKTCFDEAIEACNEQRKDMEAAYYKGSGAHPELPSKNTEENFYAAKECEVQSKLKERGIVPSERALSAIVDIVTEDTELEDFYYTD